MPFTPRMAIVLTFMAFGAMVGANVGAIPVLVAQSGVTPLIFGFMAALGTVANIAAMSLGGWINRHFDHRSVLLFIMPVVYAALVFTLSVHSVLSFAVSMIVINLGLGTLDIFMNAEGAVVEHDLGRAIFSSYHGAVMYAIGAFSIIGSVIATSYGALWCALPPLPVVGLALYAVMREIPARAVEAKADDYVPAVMPRKILLLIGATLGFTVACELTCIQWAGQLLADLQPQLAAYSGLGAAFYCVCCGTMRLMGDRLRQRFGDFTVAVPSLFVAALGMGVLSLAPGFAISVAAFAGTGFGLAVVFPTLFSLAAKLVPEAKAAALGFVSGTSGLPRIVLPMILGTLAQAYGLHAIYAAAALVCLAALVLALLVARELLKRKERGLPHAPAKT